MARTGGNPDLVQHQFKAPKGQEPKNKKLSVWVTSSMKAALDAKGKDWIRDVLANALAAESSTQDNS